jgi:hypothetical protein
MKVLTGCDGVPHLNQLEPLLRLDPRFGLRLSRAHQHIHIDKLSRELCSCISSA